MVDRLSGGSDGEVPSFSHWQVEGEHQQWGMEGDIYQITNAYLSAPCERFRTVNAMPFTTVPDLNRRPMAHLANTWLSPHTDRRPHRTRNWGELQDGHLGIISNALARPDTLCGMETFRHWFFGLGYSPE
jgi:hypothetical protein